MLNFILKKRKIYYDIPYSYVYCTHVIGLYGRPDDHS